MTPLLEKAFAAAALLPDEDQDVLAVALLAEIEAEKAFDETIEETADRLGPLAEAELAEHRAGKTEPLDSLLSAVTPENLHGEADFGSPKDNEVW